MKWVLCGSFILIGMLMAGMGARCAEDPVSRLDASMQAVRAGGGGSPDSLYSNADKVAPYLAAYCTDPNDIVAMDTVRIARSATTPVSIGVLTAMVCSQEVYVQYEAVLGLSRLKDRAAVLTYGGTQLRDNLIAALGHGRQAERLFLLARFGATTEVIDALRSLLRDPAEKSALTGYPRVPITFAVTLALAEAGAPGAAADLEKAVKAGGAAERLMLIMAGCRSRQVLAVTSELLHERTVAAIDQVPLPAIPNALRACDFALEILALDMGVDVGCDVIAHRMQPTYPRYTDAELETAYQRLTAYIKEMPADVAAAPDPLAARVEAALGRVRAGDSSSLQALAVDGEAILPHLVKYVTDPNPLVKRAVIALAQPMQTVLSVGMLTAMVNDRDAGVALLAVRSLYQQRGDALPELGRVVLRGNLLAYVTAHPYQVEALLLLRHFGAQGGIPTALGALRGKPEKLLAARPGDARPAAWLGDVAYPGVMPTLMLDCALAELGDAEAETRVVACIREGRAEDVLLLADVLPALTRPAVLRALAELVTDVPRGHRLVPERGVGIRLCDPLLEALVTRAGANPGIDLSMARARTYPTPRYTDEELRTARERIEQAIDAGKTRP